MADVQAHDAAATRAHRAGHAVTGLAMAVGVFHVHHGIAEGMEARRTAEDLAGHVAAGAIHRAEPEARRADGLVAAEPEVAAGLAATLRLEAEVLGERAATHRAVAHVEAAAEATQPGAGEW